VTLTQKVNKIIKRKEESKYHSNLIYQNSFGGTATALGDFCLAEDLTDVAQSAGASSDTTRIGDEVEISRLLVKFQMSQDVIVGQIGQTNRVIIFQWKPNSLFSVTNRPTVAELSQLLAPGPTNTGVNEYNSLSHFNHDSRSQFNVLYDQSFRQMEAGAVGVAQSDSVMLTRSFAVNLKRARKKIQYTAGSVNGMYHIWILYLGFYPQLVSAVSHNIRMYFKDA